jgi:hypothetical protein
MTAPLTNPPTNPLTAVQDQRASVLVLEQLAREGDVALRLLVVQHPRLGDLALGWLCRDRDPAVRRLAQERQTMRRNRCDPYTALGRATNPSSEEAELWSLAFDPDPRVRAAARANPTLPAEALRLAEQLEKHPTTAASNTAGTQTQIQRPAVVASTWAWLMQAGHYARELAAHQPDLPADWLVVLADDPRLAALVAGHRRTPAYLLAQLAQRLALAALVAANPSTGQATLLALAQHSDESVRLACAKNPILSAAALEVLVADPDWDVREAIVGQPSLGQRHLQQLAKDPWPSVRAAVAALGQCPTQILAQLLRDPDDEVRAAVAQNANTLLADLETLAQDPLAEVRAGVAVNPNAAPALLSRLGRDPAPLVARIALLRQENNANNLRAAAKLRHPLLRAALAQTSLVDALPANDPSPLVRSLVVINRNSSLNVLHQLSSDPAPEVRQLAQARLAGTQELRGLRSLDARMRMVVAINPRTPSERLAEMADDPNFAVRARVAENPNTPQAMLQRLLQDDLLRPLVAQNPSARALANEVLNADLRSGSDPNTSLTVLGRLAQDNNEVLRALVAENPSSDLALLTRLARDASPNVRARVAQHPLAGPLLAGLAADPAALVRLALASNPAASAKLLASLTSRKSSSGTTSNASERQSLALALAQNPQSQAKLLAALAWGTWNYAAGRATMGVAPWLARVFGRGLLAQQRLLLALAKHRNSPALLVRYLHWLNEPEIEAALAARPTR